MDITGHKNILLVDFSAYNLCYEEIFQYSHN
jgi:hypothetical protein